MSFMVWIIEELIAVEEWFYEAYLEVRDWMPPFDLLKYPLYGLYGSFMWMVEGFYEFYQWLLWAGEQLEDILSWTNIRSLIRSWLDGIEAVLDWFQSWVYWLRQEITEWWSTILPYVLTYIDEAVEGFNELVEAWDTFWRVTWPELLEDLGNLKSAWDNFWRITLPTLVSFSWLTTWWNDRLQDISALINTAIAELLPMIEGWQEIRDQVLEFFADPLKWLYDRLEGFMDRYW